MKRFLMDELIKWKENTSRKPLIIRGARQVGKTWLMKEFGAKHYKKTVYINFETNERIAQIFKNDLDINRLLLGIEIEIGFKFDTKETLLIFDEIQEVPRALTSLKYFCENRPDINIICAGSLLGIALHNGTSFPVGKVDFLDLYPLSYSEFLCSVGQEKLYELLKSNDFTMMNNFASKFNDYLKQYIFIGGMPEVVADYCVNRDFSKVRAIQKQIIFAYEQDFSKHAPNNEVPRIRTLYNSIPSQLAKENKKFIYGLVKTGARAKDYETAIMWLIDCGLIHKVSRVTSPNMPLSACEDLKAFKLFVSDIGLLSALSGLDVKSIIDGNKIFTEFKGCLAEQYVLSELISSGCNTPYYWSREKGNSKLDFLLQVESLVVPVEVKSGINLQAKSFKHFVEEQNSDVGVRISMANYKADGKIINLPLFAASRFESVINDFLK